MRRIVKPKSSGPLTEQGEVDYHWKQRFNVTSFLFDKQLAFVEDPAPFKVAVCSRRAGKTVACAAHLVHTAISNKDATCLYITLSSVQGKRIIWKEFKKIIKNFALPVKTNDTELSITFPNDSTIYVVGANDASEIEKFRGMAIKLCYIDECQSFRSYIKDLIDDIIGPALIDYAGNLCLIGTPGPVPAGYFHECAVTSDTWSRHYWTFWDNPHIAKTSGMSHQQVFDRELKRRGLQSTDPAIQREWYGKWMTDTESLWLHYDPAKNHYEQLLPHVKYNHVIGVDVGYDDADALCVLAWSEQDPNTYLVEEVITTKQGLTPLANQIKDLQKRYDTACTVMDFGGLGKKMGEELIRVHQISLEAAEKTQKMEHAEFLNDALRTGRFKAKSSSRFAQDTYVVEIDWDKTTAERIVLSSKVHSDIIDSVLYAYRKSYSFTYSPPAPDKPRWGTKEWADQQSTEMFEHEMRLAQEASEYAKWLRGEFD